jgi:hypothetical protein
MRVYKIIQPDSPHEFITNDVQDIENFPVGSTVKVTEMTPEEYHQVPATQESAKAFAR